MILVTDIPSVSLFHSALAPYSDLIP